MYVLAIAIYTIVVRNNKKSIKKNIIDGIKDMGIGFGIVFILYHIMAQILTWINCGF